MLDPHDARARTASPRALPRASHWIVVLSVPLLLLSMLVLSMQNWSTAQAIVGELQVGDCNAVTGDHATIQAAVEEAVSGTVINICPGTYPESVNLSLMGEIGDITLRKVSGQVADVNITPVISAGIWITRAEDFTGDITLENLNITAASDYGINLSSHLFVPVFVAGGTVNGSVTISGVNSNGNLGDGAFIDAIKDVLVVNSNFNNNGFYGLHILGGQSIEVIDTQANNNGSEADLFYDGSGITLYTYNFLACGDVESADTEYRVLVEGVTANDNRAWGIDIGSEWDTYIRDTEVISNAYDGVVAEVGSGCSQGQIEVTDSVAEYNGWDTFFPVGEVTTEDFYEPGGFRLLSVGPMNVSATEANANIGFGFCPFSFSSVTIHDSLAENNVGEGYLYSLACEFYGGIGSVGAEAEGEADSWDISGIEEIPYPSLVISNSSAISNAGYGGFLLDTLISEITLTNVSALENFVGIYVTSSDLSSFALDASTAIDSVVPLAPPTSIRDSHIQDNEEVGVLYEQLPLDIRQINATAAYTLFNDLNSNIICENGIGLAAEIAGFAPDSIGAQADEGFALRVDARGNWWGNATGPNAVDNPGGQGNGIEIFVENPPTDTVEVEYIPWIDTIEDSATPNPTLVGMPVDVAYQFRDSASTYFLENGVGDPNNGPIFTLSTDNGNIAGDPGKFIVNTLIEDTVTPSAAGTMTILLNGPCGLVSTQEVLVATPDIAVEKSPDAQGLAAGDSAVFTVTLFNTGDITLTDISVLDAVAPDCSRAAGALGDLPPGEQTSYTCALDGIVSNFDNEVAAAGFALINGAAAGDAVSDSDSASVFVASFALTKTVFVDGYHELIGEDTFNPSACALESAITVPVSSTVKYCYTLTNTGDYTLSLHSLVDSHIAGSLLANFAQEVGPGASFSTVDAGVDVTTTLTLSTTNIATWTAEIAAPIVSLDAKTTQVSIPVVVNAQAAVTISPDDLDQDDDGIPDNIEGTGDIDADGIPDFLDPAGPTSEPPTEQPNQQLDLFLPSLGQE